jgi:2-hydroxychromene-2-carboxylate isomerase
MQGFRDAFQKGRELGITAQVLDAGAAAGLDRNELEQALTDPEIKQTLRDATDEAHARGVFGVPTIAIGDELFWGDDRLEAAAELISRRPAR